ncbi:hypothetical protein C8R44DRAFT_656805 [Mycena epipterygia]|nr:hypothetical protein C8R44DRAFT_656805 [Mycena epipterygia]
MPTSTSKLVRSRDFWFDDGTVVLYVENTLYRVYRGLLASRSTVFRDTFAVPQSATKENAQIEGCLVVRLHDQARDFTRFLIALHHFGPYPKCPVTGYGELSSILRLSDKYNVPILRDTMISILADLYPTSLEQWINRKTLWGYTAHTASDHIRVLNIAVKLNIRPILPAVMYGICTSFDLEDIVSGISLSSSSSNRLNIVNREYRKRCILAVPKIMVAQRNAWGYLRDDLDGYCERYRECDTERIRWLGKELDNNYDVLDTLPDDYWDYFDVCSPCLAAAMKAYDDARQNLWNDLPSIFDLGTWEELLLPSGV